MVIKSEVTRDEMLRCWSVGEGLSKFNGRCNYISTLPQDTKWYLVSIAVSKNEFQGFYTIRDNKWLKYSARSCLLLDAANYLMQNRDEDSRVSSIVDKLPDVELTGITFIALDKNGPYIIVEGTGRLAAICGYHIIQGKQLSYNNIEAILGVSKQKWCWAP
jgi:hypothetical protein